MGILTAKVKHPPKYLPTKDIFVTKKYESITLSLLDYSDIEPRNKDCSEDKYEYDIPVYCHELKGKYILTAKNGRRGGLSEVFENILIAMKDKRLDIELSARYESNSKHYSYKSKTKQKDSRQSIIKIFELNKDVLISKTKLEAFEYAVNIISGDKAYNSKVFDLIKELFDEWSEEFDFVEPQQLKQCLAI